MWVHSQDGKVLLSDNAVLKVAGTQLWAYYGTEKFLIGTFGVEKDALMVLNSIAQHIGGVYHVPKF